MVTTTAPRTRSRRTPRVALVGPDGAGKSTISQMLEEATLPFPVKRIYMGINLESSSLMLPTTRLLLYAKRARGRRPDLTAVPSGNGAGARGRLRHGARELARLGVWVLEEWVREAAAAWYSARGFVVVFDRHFLADYFPGDSTPGHRGLFPQLHGWLLRHAYPKPDLVICLDAPPEVLYARKGEASVTWLARRRADYLSLAPVVPALRVVDADRPLDAVFADVVDTITNHWKASA